MSLPRNVDDLDVKVFPASSLSSPQIQDKEEKKG